MKIAFCADVHLGNHRTMGGPMKSGINTRGQLCLDALEEVVGTARGQGAHRLVILGDLFDTSRPTPQLITEALRILQEDGFWDVTTLVGNHDQDSDDEGDHTLGPLRFSGVTVVEAPVWESGTGLALLPFVAEPAPDWLPSAVAQVGANLVRDGARPAPTPRVLGLHLGLSDVMTKPYLVGAPDSIDVGELVKLVKPRGFTHVLAGNWHDHRHWNVDSVEIVQLGALVPTGFDNPGVTGYGVLAFLDTETGEVSTTAVRGPRFLKARSLQDVAEASYWAQEGFQLFVRFELPVGASALAQQVQTWLAEAKDRRWIVDGEITWDREESAQKARTAAQVARSQETLREAVAAYVQEMPLPEDVPRADVLELVKSYLKL